MTSTVPSARNRSVLQRRSGVAATFQAGLDSLSIIAIALLLIYYHIGVITLQYLLMLLLFLVILALLYDHMAVYRSNSSRTAKALKLGKAWAFGFMIMTFIGFASQQGINFSRLLMSEFFVLGLMSQVGLHLAYQSLQKRWLANRGASDNALVIGSGDLANYLSLKIANNPWMNQQLVGSIPLAGHSDADENSAQPGSGLPELGTVEDLPRIIVEQEIRVAYIVTPLGGSTLLEQVYFSLLDSNVAVHWIPDIFSLRLINHSVNELAGIPVLTLSETPLTGTRRLAKSLEDRCLSALLLFLITPLLLMIALAVKMDSSGPVFFRQERAGWNGRSFRIWKFRSMCEHEPQGGELRQATKGDSRITRVGAILRKTSLDELPQLINVLVGDMSLVGPRPHALQHDEEYSSRITDYFARHNIKPGITGLAQVRGYRGETHEIEQMVHRVESDIEYINNWSLWLDLTILLRTAAAFTGNKAY